MSNSPPSPGPDLFFGGGECLTRFGVWVRRTDMDLEEATGEDFTRNGDATAFGRDGILRTWGPDTPRAEWLNEVDLDPTRNLLSTTDMGSGEWGKFDGCAVDEPAPDQFDVSDTDNAATSILELAGTGPKILDGSTVTISAFLRKRAGAPIVHFRMQYDGSHGVIVDPETGEFTADGTPDAVRVTASGTWWLLEVVATKSVAGGLFNYQILPAWGVPGATPTSVADPTATGTNRFRDAQTEIGDVATDPQETPRDTDRKFPALFLEDARSNNFPQSTVFSGVWNAVRASFIADIGTAPDGTNTPDRCFEDATPNSTHLMQEDMPAALVADVDNTITIFAKGAGRTEFNIETTSLDGGIPSAFFRLFDGGVVGTTANGGVGRIRALPDGWFRCSFTFPSNSGGGTTTPSINVFLSEGSEDVTYDGDGSSGIDFWGVQLERSVSVGSSYIATTVGGVARAEDTFTGAFTGPPQAMTVYAKILESGGGFKSNARLVHLGDRLASAPNVRMVAQTTGRYLWIHSNGIDANENAQAFEPTVLGELQELRGVLYEDGSVELFQSIAGADETTGGRTDAPAAGLVAAWSGRFLNLGVGDGGNRSLNRFLAVKVNRGVRTLDFMRAL